MAESSDGTGGSGGEGYYAAASSTFSILQQAAATFYAARAMQYELRTRASAYRHQAAMARIDARSAEIQAVDILRAGALEKAAFSLQAAQARAVERARTGSSGIAGGSAAEVEASQRFVDELGANAITGRALRAASSVRLQRAQALGVALLSEANATSLRQFARVQDPWGSAIVSLLGNAHKPVAAYESRTTQGRTESRRSDTSERRSDTGEQSGSSTGPSTGGEA